MQDLIRVGVADAAQDRRIGERALQRVIRCAQSLAKLGGIGAEHFEPAAIVVIELRRAASDMQRRAPLRAGLGQREHAVRRTRAASSDARTRAACALLSYQCRRPAIIRWMHQPQIVFEADRDALAEAPQRHDAMAFARLQRRFGGAQQERILEHDALERCPTMPASSARGRP